MEHTKIMSIKNSYTYNFTEIFHYLILIIALKFYVFETIVDADDCWKSRLIYDDDYEY